VLLVALLVSLGLPPLLSWQRLEQQRAVSLSNLHRLSMGLLLYTQDWDGHTMRPAERRPDGSWRTWVDALHPYVGVPTFFSDPANPVAPFGPKVRHPVYGYPISSSYALNRRLWDTFSPGPFPLDNLELPGQTVLFVEAGPMWRDPRRPPRRDAERASIALLDYGDTTDRVQGFCPYPSPYEGRMPLAAVDGHAAIVRVMHYSAAEGPHDPLYGRIGDNIYDWNGGYLNGQTDSPPRE
jgi:hypothetical protein